ncbi:MAG: hypothetical protein HZC38_00470 [Chloroflexi bacterium]|nr:hypothetical protein [Chloroflexota bacterium]MBI5711891.1 hypothetical protein [Chloroflexota bacterium]
MSDQTTPNGSVQQSGISVNDSQVSVGSDFVGRDKILAEGHVIQAAAGATVIISTVYDGLTALSDLMRHSAEVNEAVITFRSQFQDTKQQIDILGDYKELHDLLHQIEFECYDVIVNATTHFPDDNADDLIKYHIKLESLIDQLQSVAAHGFVAKPDTLWIQRLASMPDELAQAINNTEAKQLGSIARRLKQLLDIQPSQINQRLNNTARALRLPALTQSLSQIKDQIANRPDLNAEKVKLFQAGVNELINISNVLANLIEDHDGWQGLEVLLNRIEDFIDQDLQELEISWADLKARSESLCHHRADKRALAFMKEIENLDETLASANPDRVRKSFLSYRNRAGELFYRVDVDLKRLCSDLRKVGEPLTYVLIMTRG